MFSRFFQKHSQQQDSQHNAPGSLIASELNPRVILHYGIPSTASILACDHTQRLLAVGTLDGRIKVIGGDNVEGLLISPRHTPIKNLEFFENQGFLVSISNDNEIQVWDLEQRKIVSTLQWESAITAFSVIHGTSYMYIGSEYGMVAVLKFDSDERNIIQLPYYILTNVIAEAVGMSSLDHVSVVRVLHQPCSQGTRLLIAYENGLLVLWDASEDKIVLTRGHKHLELKNENMTHYPVDTKDAICGDLSDQEVEKEISSLCWASGDGSVVAVGYVDGDILFWDLSTVDSTKDQQAEKLSNHVVKLQLSSAERRLPVIVLHWSASRSSNEGGGQLFVYGGDAIGSEEVLTILSLDSSSGLERLRCIGRLDLTLNGSFADMILLASDGLKESNGTELFVLTNPGQLHLYDQASLSASMSQQEKKTSASAMQYPVVILTLEPRMTKATIGLVYRDEKLSKALSEIAVAAKLAATCNQSTAARSWPLTGGVASQIFKTDGYHVNQLFIAGYQDGSVQIWDITYPPLSLVYSLGSEVKDVNVAGTNASVSALEICSETLQLAIGNNCGLVRLYELIRSCNKTNLHVVTESGTEVYNIDQVDGPQCTAVFSLLNSAVCTLKFVNSGARLAVGYECGHVAMLDVSTSSILFLAKSLSNTASGVISLEVKYFDSSSLPENLKDSESKNLEYSSKGIVFIMTRNANFFALDGVSGNILISRSMNSKEHVTAISMFIIDGRNFTSELTSEIYSLSSPPKTDPKSPSLQANSHPESTSGEFETISPADALSFGQRLQNLFLLLCCESELGLYSLKSVIEDCSEPIQKVNPVTQCCWTRILKKDDYYCGLVVLYQSGTIEVRSLPSLEVVVECSLMSLLRWNLKANMDETICATTDGQIILVNGNEVALISFMAYENELRTREFLPCLHDKVLAAAANATVSLSPCPKERQVALNNASYFCFHLASRYLKLNFLVQGAAPSLLGGIIKNIKAVKAEQNASAAEVNTKILANLERIFSSPLFLKPSEDINIDIDDIKIDEPVAAASSTPKETIEKKKKKGTEREKLFEGASSDTKPRVRTTEEIKAKYRKGGAAGDASAAAAQAKDKLMERQEKLERLSQRTEELQSGAQNFAEMASELAKQMEKRKWWHM